MEIKKPLPNIVERLRNLQEASGALEKLRKGIHDQGDKLAYNHTQHVNHSDNHTDHANHSDSQNP